MNTFKEAAKSRVTNLSTRSVSPSLDSNVLSIFSFISSSLSFELTSYCTTELKSFLLGCIDVIVFEPMLDKVVVQSKPPSSLVVYSKFLTIPTNISISPFASRTTFL